MLSINFQQLIERELIKRNGITKITKRNTKGGSNRKKGSRVDRHKEQKKGWVCGQVY